MKTVSSQKPTTWDVEFEAEVNEQDVAGIASVLIYADGTAEVDHTSYFTPENTEVRFTPSARLTQKLVDGAFDQYDSFMQGDF